MFSVSRASFVFKEALKFITISKLLDLTEMLVHSDGRWKEAASENRYNPLLKLLAGGFNHQPYLGETTQLCQDLTMYPG